MAAPNRPFPVNPALTAIAIGYRNDRLSFVADRFLPRVPVGGERFSWTYHPVAQAFTVPDTRVPRTGRVGQLEFSGEQRDASVEDYGLDSPIPQTDIIEARRMRDEGLGTHDPEGMAVELLTDVILIDRELRVAAIAQNPNTYAASRRVALSGTSKFSDYANSDPIAVIKAAIAGTFIFRPNTMTTSAPVLDVLSSHPHIVNAVRGNVTGRGIVSREEIAKLFNLKEVLVGESYVNSARVGQPENIVPVWGNHISFTYVNPQARPESGLTFGLTATYGTRISGSIEDKDVGLLGGRRVRVGERVRELITAPDVGFFLQNVI